MKVRRRDSTVIAIGLVIGISAAACVGGADNVTSLSDKLREAASQLNTRANGSTLTIPYEPVDAGASPYIVLFFPDREVKEDEIIAAGVDANTAHRIYSELASLGSMANALVVDQDGRRPQFTTSWKTFARVQQLVVSKRKTGAAQIDLEREDDIVTVAAIR